jgi:hypothetical protein
MRGGGLLFVLVVVAACGSGAAPAPSPPSSPSSSSSSSSSPSPSAGAATPSREKPRDDRCAAFVAHDAEDLAFHISDFAVLEWIDVDAATTVLARECKTWTDEELRCVMEPGPDARDKRTCLSGDKTDRLRSVLKPILDARTPDDIRAETRGVSKCEYARLVEEDLQRCKGVSQKMREKVLRQWYRAATVATPLQSCLDAETVLRRRLASAGCPVPPRKK